MTTVDIFSARHAQAIRDWVAALRATGKEPRGVEDLLDEYGNLRDMLGSWFLQVSRNEVKQGRYFLRQLRHKDGYALGFPVEYCCMGVACQISNLGEWGYQRQTDREFVYIIGSETIGEIPADDNKLHSTKLMPNDVREEYGLRTPRGDFMVVPEWLETLKSQGAASMITAQHIKHYLRFEPSMDMMLPTSLSDLNDCGLSFHDIANIIESNPPGLFEH